MRRFVFIAGLFVAGLCPAFCPIAPARAEHDAAHIDRQLIRAAWIGDINEVERFLRPAPIRCAGACMAAVRSTMRVPGNLPTSSP